MKLILGGHWTNPPEGWEAWGEDKQDITAPLKCADNSVDVLFLEHVHEHINLTDGVLFLREAFRVLKAGGVIRIVGPYIDKMIEFVDGPTLSRDYTVTNLAWQYKPEKAMLEELYVDFSVHGQAFLFDSLLKRHNHKFVWTTRLLHDVLRAVGFNEFNVCEPGDTSFDPADCIERRVRGISAQAQLTVTDYDPESLVVEARK